MARSGSLVWEAVWRGGSSCHPSVLYFLVLSLIRGSDFPKALRPQLWFCSPQYRPWGLWPVVNPLLSSSLRGAMSPGPNCLNLLSEGRISRKHWHSPAQHAECVPDSPQPAGPAPGPVAPGSRMDDSGKLCWTKQAGILTPAGDDCN